MISGFPEHVDLLGLLSGELAPSTRAGVTAHVRGCPTCTEQLLQTAVMVGELRDAARHAPVDPAQVPPLDLSLRSLTAPPSVVGVAPDRGRRRAHLTNRAARAARWVAGPRRAGLLLAAAATVAVAFTAGLLAAPGAGPSGTQPAASATVQLIAVGLTPSPASGHASMIGAGPTRKMQLTLTGLPQLGPDQHYEVWLMNTRTGRSTAIGPAADTTATFDLPESATAGYNALDISRQSDADGAVHSPDSLLRGGI
jgi:anti-sigma factor RsiW